MRKVLRPGTITTYGGGHVSIFLKIETEQPFNSKQDAYLSITGVIGPSSGGNAYGGCGQIVMEFKHRRDEDDDSRYSSPTRPEDISFSKGWDAELWYDLIDIWEKWHLKRVNEVPQDVLLWLQRLPDSDRRPAWV